MVSLQEQLLKAGLVDKKKVKKAKLAKHTHAKKQPKGHVQFDKNKQEAEQKLAERIEQDKALNKEKQLQANKKAIFAQIIQLIETNIIDRRGGEISYQFTDGKIIAKIYVSELLQKQLSKGIVAIVKLNNNYEIIPAIVAEKIKQRNDSAIILLNDSIESEIDENDPYADYQIPDDLMW